MHAVILYKNPAGESRLSAAASTAPQQYILCQIRRIDVHEDSTHAIPSTALEEEVIGSALLSEMTLDDEEEEEKDLSEVKAAVVAAAKLADRP